jgi:hypothetical protein
MKSSGSRLQQRRGGGGGGGGRKFKLALYLIGLTVASCSVCVFVFYFNTLSSDYDVNVYPSLSNPAMMIKEAKPSAMDTVLVPVTTTTTIAYAVSLIKCSDKISTPKGLTDASMVLRHSIHQNSIRNPMSGSKYDYKMYAIVHEQAVECSAALADAGFELVVKRPPIEKQDIQSKYLRETIHKEVCCGHDEFIKLYAYLLEEPIVVHLDMDFIFHKPLDDLFDVMLLPNDNNDEPKSRVHRERPNEPWPATVDAFLTRDWPLVKPGRIAGFQAGFIVLRPSQTVFDEIVQVIKTAEYVEGFSRQNGWGGKGYGGFIGAKAMQGLLAYYYDHIRPGNWVELNQCRYNHMGMNLKVNGKCRNNQAQCEDCMDTPMDEIYNIHFTKCRKPWSCIGEVGKGVTFLPEGEIHADHCLALHKIWHDHRSDLELKLMGLTGDMDIRTGMMGLYKKESFQGHCGAHGEYLPISAKEPTLQQISELYNPQS